MLFFWEYRNQFSSADFIGYSTFLNVTNIFNEEPLILLFNIEQYTCMFLVWWLWFRHRLQRTVSWNVYEYSFLIWAEHHQYVTKHGIVHLEFFYLGFAMSTPGLIAWCTSPLQWRAAIFLLDVGPSYCEGALHWVVKPRYKSSKILFIFLFEILTFQYANVHITRESLASWI